MKYDMEFIMMSLTQVNKFLINMYQKDKQTNFLKNELLYLKL